MKDLDLDDVAATSPQAAAELAALRAALADLLQHAERANEIMRHEAGIGVIDSGPLERARAALAAAAPTVADPTPAMQPDTHQG